MYRRSIPGMPTTGSVGSKIWSTLSGQLRMLPTNDVPLLGAPVTKIHLSNFIIGYDCVTPWPTEC